jgi:hypothetical protein
MKGQAAVDEAQAAGRVELADVVGDEAGRQVPQCVCDLRGAARAPRVGVHRRQRARPAGRGHGCYDPDIDRRRG